jgi:hypothetical protein
MAVERNNVVIKSLRIFLLLGFIIPYGQIFIGQSMEKEEHMGMMVVL